MLKKCFTFVLAMLMCFAMVSTPVIATDVSTVEASDASTEATVPESTEATVPETTEEFLPVPFQMLPDGEDQSRVWRTADGVYHIRATEEYMESYYGASDEILAGDTMTLLIEILDGRLMWNEIFMMACKCSDEPSTNAFVKHEGYQELLTRADLISAIEEYAKTLPTDDDFNSMMKRKMFSVFLKQAEISLLLNTSDFAMAIETTETNNSVTVE